MPIIPQLHKVAEIDTQIAIATFFAQVVLLVLGKQIDSVSSTYRLGPIIGALCHAYLKGGVGEIVHSMFPTNLLVFEIGVLGNDTLNVGRARSLKTEHEEVSG